jgi:hypothetical protein|tara:strand:- start:124 stop:486 length:363 start_codon:yes stop_codon:yes gene_type:complete
MFEKLIESPHGMGQLKAVFETHTARYSESSSTGYTLGATAEELSGMSSNSDDLNYQMYYWVSAASRLAFMKDGTSNNQPMIWRNAEQNSTQFFANGLGVGYSDLSIDKKAEKHFLEVILA